MASSHQWSSAIMANTKSNPIVIKLPEDSGAGQASPLFAYVLDGDGEVVETTPFKGRTAHLGAPAETVKASRLFIGAAFPADYPPSKIDAYSLSESGAYQVSVAFNKDNEIAIPRLPANIGIHQQYGDHQWHSPDRSGLHGAGAHLHG
jgi:hypothetical protein